MVTMIVGGVFAQYILRLVKKKARGSGDQETVSILSRLQHFFKINLNTLDEF